MNELLSKAARLAVLIKKPTKTDAHKVVKKLINQGIIEGNEAATLYAYFAPPIRKITSAFQWVALAAAKKDPREFTKFVYCDGESIIATNGHRLHVAPNDSGLAVGYYDKLGIIVEVEYSFPDYKRVIPKGTTIETTLISECEIQSFDHGLELVKLPSGHYVQRNYLNDALGANKIKESFTYSYDNVQGAIKVEYDGLVAVIMPCRM